jgi:hypothetical protein
MSIRMAPFPAYVHSVFDPPTTAWPVTGQTLNACSVTTLANALNLLTQSHRYHPHEFRRELGPFFQAALGGTLPFLKTYQLRRRGYGSHFGCLRYTDCEKVLCQLIDYGIPTILDIYTAAQFGRQRVFGQHAVLLVGYSDPYTDASGKHHMEYYVLDSQWPELGDFRMDSNNVDRDGDGVPEDYPGNRTLNREEFLRVFTTRCYAPVFRSQHAHDRWYATTMQWRRPRLTELLITGSYDRLKSPK